MMNIIGRRYINFTVSGLLFLASIGALLAFGLKLGNDFTGGSLLEFRFTARPLATEEVKTSLNTLNFGDISIQKTDANGALVKTRFLSEAEHQQTLAKLRADFEKDDSKVLEIRFETIGPAVSQTLKQRTIWAIILVVVSHIIYIAYAFRRVSKPVSSWKYGVAAELAMIHDVTITSGVFAFLGHFLNIEVDIPFVVALLTVLGYSVNDTIVIFDRIRENVIRRSADNFISMVNVAVNETFARSINTTLTVLLSLAALFFLGGETIKYFSLALLVGIFLGAYSSIFVASPLLVEWYNWQNRKRR